MNGNGNGRAPRDPWERQVGETAKAFYAFNVYRQLGPSRSIRATGEKLGKTATHLEKWSHRFDWVIRAGDWDAHMAGIARAAEIVERTRMAKRHVQIGVGLQNEVIRSLQARQLGWERHLADPANVKAPKPLDASDVRHWALAGVTIERLARGEATERHEHGPTPPADEPGRNIESDIVERILADPELAAAADTLAAAVEGLTRSDGGEADEAPPQSLDPPSAP